MIQSIQQNGLQQIIDTIREAGYEIVALEELVYKENYTIDNTGRQRNR